MNKRRRSIKKHTTTPSTKKCVDKLELSMSDKENIEKGAQAFQSGVDRIRDGRTTAGYKLFDFYHDWFNNLMSISITIGVALVALSTTPDFGKHINPPYFWFAVILLVCNGIYILLFKKRGFEDDSIKLAAMGYETEYYLLFLRNRTQDIVKGKPVDPNELVTTKDILISKTSAEIDKSYQNSKKIDHRMDTSVLVLISSLLLLVLSTVKDESWLIVGVVSSLAVIITFLLFFKHTTKEARDVLAERDKWLEKVKSERLRG